MTIGDTSALLSGGDVIDTVPVKISYRIIELFSRGLYSSPHKALEELVSNSYDAMAQNVWLLVPSDLANPTETIWVVDDGESMSASEFHDLWRIADSTKRDTNESKSRPPIGKFGIGKLATYVLARQLTYVCHKDERTLAITMDYGQIDQDKPTDETKLVLSTRELEGDEVRAALSAMQTIEGGEEVIDLLCSPDAPTTWTAAALSNLTPAVADMKLGRIRWLLSTALPKSPGFNLELNGREVPSSVDSRAVTLASWRIGENDSVPNGTECGIDEEGPYVRIDGLKGKLRGTVAIYEDVLTKGKAAKNGHSHGFFVKVRERLVNIDDPLFGLPALSHAAFNRFRLEVQADGLDEYLASTREAIISRGPVPLFQSWLRTEFNTARGMYDSWAARSAADVQVPARIGSVAASLSRRPLVAAVTALIRGEAHDLVLVQRPLFASDDERDALVQRLNDSLESAAGPIADVLLEPLGVDRYIAAYDPVDQVVRVNSLHPFFANFEGSSNSHQTFQMLAVAEVLTEAYIVEATGDSDLANAVIARRDAFMRDLVRGRRDGPAAIAQYLLDQAGNPAGLPDAVADALRSLGLQVSPLAQRTEPDGVAVAAVGPIAPDDLESHRRQFGLVFETKAAVGRSISVPEVAPALLSDARNRLRVEYALAVVAQVDASEDGAFADALSAANVTVITARDLALLVEVAAIKQLGFSRLADWLESCRAPSDSSAWIQAALAEPVQTPILQELLQTIADLQSAGPDPVEVPAIVAILRSRVPNLVDRAVVGDLIRSLQTLAPGFVSFNGRSVVLETSLDNVLREIGRHSAELAPSLLTSSVIDPIFSAEP